MNSVPWPTDASAMSQLIGQLRFCPSWSAYQAPIMTLMKPMAAMARNGTDVRSDRV